MDWRKSRCMALPGLRAWLEHGLGTCHASSDLLGYTDSKVSRLCVYARSNGSRTWADYANGCHSNYGAFMCNADQIRIAIDNNIITSSNIQRYWMADADGDDQKLHINRDGDESDWKYNYDGESDGNSETKDGVYCCRMYHNAGY